MSKTEIKVLQLIAHGLENPEVADTLHISIETIRKHRSNILTKVPFGNMVALIQDGFRNGWLDAENNSNAQNKTSFLKPGQ